MFDVVELGGVVVEIVYAQVQEKKRRPRFDKTENPVISS